MAPARRFGLVDVAVDVDCPWRDSAERQMAEAQRWVRGAQGRDVHAVEAGVVPRFGVVVVVAEHQESLSWAVPQVEHRASVAGGVSIATRSDDRGSGAGCACRSV